MAQLYIYEDRASRFFPLAATRPVYLLRCGLSSLEEKIRRCYPSKEPVWLCRRLLEPLLKKRFPNRMINQIKPGPALFVNGRVLAEKPLAGLIPMDGDERVYRSGDTLVAVRTADALKVYPALEKGDGFEGWKVENMEVPVLSYLWDLLKHNGGELIREIPGVKEEFVPVKALSGVHAIGESVFVRQGALVLPGSVLDARDGPIYIEEGATVLPHAYIQGPVSIGRKTTIKAGAKIYGNTSIGDWCKVGGELEGSIIQGFSNKQHDGFLGHAYLGEWVNLGAGTDNSDLKNNYSAIRVTLEDETVDTGLQFLGLLMGDHSKSAIHTMFNTGTVVGVCCNLFGSGFPPKFIPSFSWVGDEGIVEYRPDKALDTARKVMARREVTMEAEYADLLSRIYDDSAAMRKIQGE